MTDHDPPIPADIIERAACFDAAWPLQPDLKDRPFRMKFWGEGEGEFSEHLASAGIPVTNGGAWAATLAELVGARRAFWDKFTRGKIIMTTFRGPGWGRENAPERVELDDIDGRQIATLVAEIHLPDGRRHLLAYEDYVVDAEVVRFIWFDGNWSCDCNRSLDLHRDGVLDLGFPLGDDGEPDAPCSPAGSTRPSLRLGWLVLRFRHLVTGQVRFEVVAGADGVPVDPW